jgi:hypothetical protein
MPVSNDAHPDETAGHGDVGRPATEPDRLDDGVRARIDAQDDVPRDVGDPDGSVPYGHGFRHAAEPDRGLDGPRLWVHPCEDPSPDSLCPLDAEVEYRSRDGPHVTLADCNVDSDPRR